MYITLRILYSLLSRLPFNTLEFIGRTTGSAMYYILQDRRKVAYKNCEIIGIPEKDRKRIVKSSFKHTFCSYIESFYTKNIDSAFLVKMVSVEHRGEKPENLACFMVSAHFGGWEVGSYVMTEKLGLKGAVVGRKLKDPKVDEFIREQRKNSIVSVIYHRNATESIKRYMDKGESIGVFLDHSATSRDCFAVPFFGINTTFIKGVPLLAVRRNYPILPAFILREQKGFKLITYPLMYPDKALKPKERAHDLALRINKVYEEIIREHPEQWYLIHKRFKKTTDAEGRFKATNFYK